MLINGETELARVTHPRLGVVILYHRKAGSYVAGAGMIEKPEGWGVCYRRDNARHGRQFGNYQDAATVFAECTHGM